MKKKKSDPYLMDDLIILARLRISLSTPDNPAPYYMIERAKEKLSCET